MKNTKDCPLYFSCVCTYGGFDRFSVKTFIMVMGRDLVAVEDDLKRLIYGAGNIIISNKCLKEKVFE